MAGLLADGTSPGTAVATGSRLALKHLCEVASVPFRECLLPSAATDVPRMLLTSCGLGDAAHHSEFDRLLRCGAMATIILSFGRAVSLMTTSCNVR